MRFRRQRGICRVRESICKLSRFAGAWPFVAPNLLQLRDRLARIVHGLRVLALQL
jgi:hypothetical protein